MRPASLPLLAGLLLLQVGLGQPALNDALANWYRSIRARFDRLAQPTQSPRSPAGTVDIVQAVNQALATLRSNKTPPPPAQPAEPPTVERVDGPSSAQRGPLGAGFPMAPMDIGELEASMAYEPPEPTSGESPMPVLSPQAMEELVRLTRLPDDVHLLAQLSPEEQMERRRQEATAMRRHVERLYRQLKLANGAVPLANQSQPASAPGVGSDVRLDDRPLFDPARPDFELSREVRFSVDKLVLQQLLFCRIDDEQAGRFRPVETVLQEIAVGDILEVKRPGYSHFSVYLGRRRVLQLQNPYFRNMTPATVFRDFPSLTLITPIEQVANGCVCRVNNKQKHRFPVDADRLRQRIRVALSTNGTQPYNVFANNCEHFATFIRFGFGFSEQIRTLIQVAIDVGEQLCDLLFEANIR